MITQSLNSIRWTSVLLFLSLTLFSSCLSDDEGGVTLADLSLQVTGTEHLEGLEVRLTNTSTATTFTSTTDADGVATFRVVPGIYEAVVCGRLRDDAGSLHRPCARKRAMPETA